MEGVDREVCVCLLGQGTRREGSNDTASLLGAGLQADKGALPTYADFPVPAAQATGKAESFGVLCTCSPFTVKQGPRS